MSKALEALRKLFIAEDYELSLLNHGLDVSEEFEIYKVLLKALTPPTTVEVRKALSEHFGGVKVVYKKGNFSLVNETGYDSIVEQKKDNYGNYVIDFHGETLPTHLVTILGRFYENEKKEEKKCQN